MWPFDSQRKNSTSKADGQLSDEAMEAIKPAGFFSTDFGGKKLKMRNGIMSNPLEKSIQVAPPTVTGVAMDSDISGDRTYGANSLKPGSFGGVPEAQLDWYASQGFFGYAVCAVMAQHWLIDKACLMPGRDAVRQGYDISIDAQVADPEAVIKAMKAFDKRYGINKSMTEFIHMGRVFGIRIAIFRVDSTDPEYYEKPFNPDGVVPGSYRGISQVDPIWCTPELTTASVSEPDSRHFYEPTFWKIGGRRYHRSHLCIFVPFPVADILKPTYQYGGVSLPQRIYERVYAAERTANEAPQLAMTKRMTVLKVNAKEFMANLSKAAENLLVWCGFRDNYGVKVIDKNNEDIGQFETSLTDLDATIMTQYQLVASIANVIATKLLGTTPKGFNSTGEYEEAIYREELESIQANDLTPLLEGHHLRVMRSEVAPKLGIQPVPTTVSWSPLDSPTAEEWATIGKTKAETDAIYAGLGAIDGVDVRAKISADKDSDYFGLAEVEAEEELAPLEGSALDSTLFDPATGEYAGARLITNQKYLDRDIVNEKRAERDYEVQVTPEFTDAKGSTYRVIIDGHHSLAAAIADGVPPQLIEADYQASEYHNAVTNGVAFDGKD